MPHSAANPVFAKKAQKLMVNLLTQYYTGLLAKQGLNEGRGI